MGAWDVGSFDNDTAVDWSYGLERTDDLSWVERALDEALAFGPSDSVSTEVGECAVAAADVVARLRGGGGESNGYTQTVDDWVSAHPLRPPAELLGKALAVIRRVSTSPSDLLELWEESGDGEGWQDALQDLRARLGA